MASPAHNFVSFRGGCERLYGGEAGMERLCKMLLCLRQRNLRQSLWLANCSLLDWKTHTFLLNLFSSKPNPLFFSILVPESPLLILVVHCPLVFPLSPPHHFSVPPIFVVPFSFSPSVNSSPSISHRLLFLFPSPPLAFRFSQ